MVTDYVLQTTHYRHGVAFINICKTGSADSVTFNTNSWE